MHRYECICFITNHKEAKHIIKDSRKKGISRGVSFYGSGTIRKFWRNLLEVDKYEREIIIFIEERKKAFDFMDEAAKTCRFSKPGRGIAFSLPIIGITGLKAGSCCCEAGSCCCEDEKFREEGDSMYCVVTIIVDKGDAEKVLEAAQSAGAKGGTIINARAAGKEETSRVFNMEIEPEKEVLFILTKCEECDDIVKSVIDMIGKEGLGGAVVYRQQVSKVSGLYE